MKKLFKLAELLKHLGLHHDSDLTLSLAKLAQELSDFRTYDEGGASEPSPETAIGYEAAGIRGEIDLAKRLMEKTKDKWIIIAPNVARRAREIVKTDEFRTWLEEKDYPADAKILLVGTKKFLSDDFISGDWILHDIIGHSIDKVFSAKYGSTARRIEEELSGYGIIEDMLVALHNSIPDGIRLSKYRTDMMPDIFAAIFFGHINRSVIDSVKAKLETMSKYVGRVEREVKEAVETMNTIFEVPEEWMREVEQESVQVGKNMVYIVEVW
jgi:hypothetical protein